MERGPVDFLILNESDEFAHLIEAWLLANEYTVKILPRTHRGENPFLAHPARAAFVNVLEMGGEVSGVSCIDWAKDAGAFCIATSSFGSYALLKKLLNHGADYFLEKPFNDEEFRQALGSMNRKSRLSWLECFATDRRLTPKETEVFQMLVRGHPSKEISVQLSQSEKTVKAHISSIFRKCRVGSRSELFSTVFPV